jgi:hypothetical protein
MAKITRVTERDAQGNILTDYHPGAVSSPSRVLAFSPVSRSSVGLGDLVARLADPIARLADRHLRTKLAGCSACSRRRAWLNRLLPDLRRPWRLHWPFK